MHMPTLETPLSHALLVQSRSAAHVRPVAQFGHLPPQSTSLS